MTFWDTIMGHQLADTLNRCLPKLTEDKPKQSIYKFETEKDLLKLQELLNKGYHVVTTFSLPDKRDRIYFVIENPCD